MFYKCTHIQCVSLPVCLHVKSSHAYVKTPHVYICGISACLCMCVFVCMCVCVCVWVCVFVWMCVSLAEPGEKTLACEAPLRRGAQPSGLLQFSFILLSSEVTVRNKRLLLN